jgi:hypothetical protein
MSKRRCFEIYDARRRTIGVERVPRRSVSRDADEPPEPVSEDVFPCQIAAAAEDTRTS